MEATVAEVLKLRAASLAAPVEVEDAERLSFGVFTVGPHHLAVPLQYFQQVFEVRHMTAIPCSSASLLGVCMASGHPVTLVNTGDFFRLRSVVATDMRNGVVISNGERTIAFGARDLLGIEEVDAARLHPLRHESTCLTHAFNGRLLISPDLVFADPRLSSARA